jgi:AraC-like DNA-binding protein
MSELRHTFGTLGSMPEPPDREISRSKGRDRHRSPDLTRSANPQELVVLAIVTNGDWHRHILQALHSRATVVCAPHMRWSSTEAQRQPDVVLVHLDPKMLCEASLWLLLSQLRRRFVDSILATYCDLSESAVRLLTCSVRAGIETTWLRGHDQLPLRLLELVEKRCAAAMVGAVLGRIRPVPPSIGPIVVHCLERVLDTVPTVHVVAQEMHVHRRTLASRFRAAGYPPPAVFISWSRLLLSAHLLDDPLLNVSQVARRLHFPSASQYRGMLRRYIGITPMDLRRRGALATVVDRFGLICKLGVAPSSRPRASDAPAVRIRYGVPPIEGRTLSSSD